MLLKKFTIKVALLLLSAQAAYAVPPRHDKNFTSAYRAIINVDCWETPSLQLQGAQSPEDIPRKDTTGITTGETLTEEMDDNTKITLLIWAFVTVFVISKVFLVRMMYLRSKLNKAKLKAVEAEAALLAEQQETERQKVQTQTALVEEKEREMVAIALKMAHNNDRLHDIVAMIEQKKISTLVEAKAEINKVIAHDDFWNFFDLRFTQLHPDFKARLSETHPDLSKSEIDFCCLLRLNLSNKEISSLLSISYESVISKRYRIRKKMGLNEEDDLNSLLEAI